MSSKSVPSPNYINPIQALFGASWGLWYAGMTQTVLSSTASAVTGIKIEFIKGVYIFASLIIVSFIAYIIKSCQVTVSEVFGFFEQAMWPKEKIKDFFKWMFALAIVLWGFLITTYFLFPSLLSGFVLLFGAVQPFFWLIMEGYTVKKGV